MNLVQDFFYLAVAVCPGAAIGFERQWRQRLGGLDQYLGCWTCPEINSPTRVAAQVVSGIGFLGAGLIFKEGLSIRGRSAVGVLAGADECMEELQAPRGELFMGDFIE